ncbi:hypothetical protein EH223_03050 [candidate division KSB1 bacterium]|nr:carbohydrate binding family 9 domain-containing protein [candidate division KSB1 bacterium]RQW06119.1 MAG: hypothetical protein EH223_03050 [candidate division KSB1 bacterium]
MQRFRHYLALYVLTGIFTPVFLIATPHSNPGTAAAREQNFRPNEKTAVLLRHFANPILVDGAIEETWYDQTPFDNFTEYQPVENRQPMVETRGFVGYDEKNIYVAFICSDPDMRQLRASYANRDLIFQDDWVCVTLDPTSSHQSAYQVYANARGIQGDRLWQLNGDEQDYSYDLVWHCDAQIHDSCWTVEMQIPFESLRFPDQQQQTWSVHLSRNYPRDNQYRFSWMPITQNNNSFMGQAGTLEFEMPKRESQTALEFLPYALATYHQNLVENPAEVNFGTWKTEQPDTRAGFGFKYGLSSDMIVDLTYNPDFSQIESDAGQISINNPFALFFPERRPFFQEGSDVYVVDQFTQGIMLDQYVNLFYSRSINNPLVAGKLSGKAGNIALGYTTAIDRNTPYIIPFEESSAVLATDRQSVNNIARANYDFGNQSTLGFLASDRRGQPDGSNTVGSIDATIRLSEKLMLTGIAAFTHTQEPVDSLLSQQIGNRTFNLDSKTYTGAFDGESFNGSLLRAKLARASRHWTAAFAYQDFSPGFRAENGFVMTTGYHSYEATSGYAFRWENHKLFTTIEPRVTAWRRYNYAGLVKDTGASPTMRIDFHNQITWLIGGFLFNQENLRGKQFGHARQLWNFVNINATKSFSTQFYIRVGKEINRMGSEGNPYNPFDIVPSVRFNCAITVKPTARINNELQFTSFNLWRSFFDQPIMNQKIFRNILSYQLSRNLGLRYIVEYNIANVVNSANGTMLNFRNLSCEPLVSYKLNAFSVFYIGGFLGAKNNHYLDWHDVRFNDQSIYMKMQYLIGR